MDENTRNQLNQYYQVGQVPAFEELFPPAKPVQETLGSKLLSMHKINLPNPLNENSTLGEKLLARNQSLYDEIKAQELNPEQSNSNEYNSLIEQYPEEESLIRSYQKEGRPIQTIQSILSSKVKGKIIDIGKKQEQIKSQINSGNQLIGKINEIESQIKNYLPLIKDNRFIGDEQTYNKYRSLVDEYNSLLEKPEVKNYQNNIDEYENLESIRRKNQIIEPNYPKTDWAQWSKIAMGTPMGVVPTVKSIREYDIRDNTWYKIDDSFKKHEKLQLSDSWNKLVANPSELLPYIGGIKETGDLLGIAEIAKRYKDGDKITSDEYKALTNFITYSQKKPSVGYIVGEILSAQPSFWGEIATTYGVFSAGKEATIKGGLKVLSKTIGKESGEEIGKRAFVRIPMKIAGTLVGGAIQTPIAGATRITTDMVRNMMPEMQIGKDEVGEIVNIIDNGDEIGTALLKSIGTNYIEYTTEQSGGSINEVGRLIGNVLKRGSGSNIVKTAFIKAFAKLNPGAKISKVKNITNRIGWHGMIGEMWEERLGEVGRAALGLEDYKLPTKDQLLAELIGFSIPGAGFKVAEYLTRASDSAGSVPEETQQRVTLQAEETQTAQPEYKIGNAELNRKQAMAIINSAENVNDIEGLKVNNDAELESMLTDKYNSIAQPQTPTVSAAENIKAEQPVSETASQIEDSDIHNVSLADFTNKYIEDNPADIDNLDETELADKIVTEYQKYVETAKPTEKGVVSGIKPQEAEQIIPEQGAKPMEQVVPEPAEQPRVEAVTPSSEMARAVETPDAKYIGMQKRPDGTEIPLFNIIKEGHPRQGSTVSAKTLTELGLQVPEITKRKLNKPEVQNDRTAREQQISGKKRIGQKLIKAKPELQTGIKTPENGGVVQKTPESEKEIVRPNEYYQYHRTENGETKYDIVDNAKKYISKARPDLDLFIFKLKTESSNFWSVTEGRTGLRIAIGKNIATAKLNAEKTLENNKDNIDNKINSYIESQGISPRYKEAVGETPYFERPKEIWQMTKTEYAGEKRFVSKKSSQASPAWAAKATEHFNSVKQALAENKPVPAEVLKDYPVLSERPRMLRKPVQTQTPEFSKWFGNSKVVDKDGKPLVVYHGSPENFNIFKFDKIGEQGTTEGKGFYFTPNKEIAAGYATKRGEGKLFEVYLKIENPASNDTRTISKADLRKILLELHKNDPDALSNYGDIEYEGFNNVLNLAVNTENASETDTELIGSLSNGGIGTLEDVLAAVTKITGKDGIITKWKSADKTPIMVAFSPTQIKSATENVGTFDITNPDIRYLRKPSQTKPTKRLVKLSPEARKSYNEWKSAIESENIEDMLGVIKAESGEKQISIDTSARAYDTIKHANDIYTKVFNGKNLVVLDSPMTINGVQYKDRIFISNESSDPIPVVFTHELMHEIQRNNPDLYGTLKNLFRDELKVSISDIRETYKSLNVENLSDEEILDEALSTFVGEKLSDNGFWNKVNAESPSLAKRMLDAIKEFVRKITEYFKGKEQRINEFVNNADSVVKMAENVIGEYAGEKQKATEGKPEFMAAPVADTFYMQSLKVVQAKFPDKMATKSITNWLRNNQVKPEELEWLDIDSLTKNRFSITKQELIDYIRANEIRVSEITYEDKYEGVEEYAEELTGDAQEEVNKLQEALDRLFNYYWEISELEREQQYEELSNYQKNELDELNEKADKIKNKYGDETLIEEKIREIIDNQDNYNTFLESGTKYPQYTVPGGENYRELLLTLPSEEPHNITGGMTYDRLSDAQKERLEKAQRVFRSSHFDEPNILAHIRFNERTEQSPKAEQFDIDYQKWIDGGKRGNRPNPDDYGRDNKVLFIEELQSDWAQKGKEKGYSPNTTEWTTLNQTLFGKDAITVFDKDKNVIGSYETVSKEKAIKLAVEDYAKFHNMVPNTPFKSEKSWSMLAFKRMIRWAAENGFDKIAWTTGEMQAERYDLSKQVEKIRWDAGNAKLYATPIGESEELMASDVNEKDLAKYVGKDASRKLIESDWDKEYSTAVKTLTGLDLKVGGTGMKSFYDEKLKGFVEKYVKQWSGRVSDSKVGDMTVPSIEITPAMRESAVRIGQPMFAKKSRLEDKTKELEAKVKPFGAGENLKEIHYQSTLIKEKINAIKQGHKLGELDTKEYLADLQKQIYKYAQEHLPKDQITRGQVTQLLTKVKNAKDVDTLEDAFSKIDAIFNTVSDRVIRAKIKNLLGKYKPKKKNGIIAGKLMPEEQASLKEISDIINSDRDEMLSEIEAERNEILSQMKYDRTDLSEEELQDVIDLTDIKERLKKVDLYSDLKNKTGAELKEIYDEIKSIIEEGKTRRTVIKELWKLKIDNLINIAINDIVPEGKSVYLKHEAQAKRLLRKNKLFAENMSFEWMLDAITANKKAKTLRGQMTDTLNKMVHNSRNNETSGSFKYFDIFHDKLKEIYGHGGIRLNATLNSNSDEKPTGITVERIDPATNETVKTELRLSQNQAYKVWQWYQDPLLKPTFDAMGFTPEVMQKIDGYLKPEVKKWAEWQIKEFYPEYYKSVNEQFRKHFFMDMPFNPFYSPLYRSYVTAEKFDEQLLQTKNVVTTVLNGHLKNRVRNKVPVDTTMDGDSVIARHIVEMEHFKSWDDTIRTLRAIFNNKTVIAAIEQYHGRNSYRVIERFINDLARGGIDRSLIISMADKLRAHYVRAVLASPVIALKQMTAIPAFALDIPVAQFGKGLTSFLVNPIKAIRTLSESKYIKARYGIGWERDVISALHRTTTKKLAGRTKITDMLMIFPKLGDKTSVMIGGWTVYQYHYGKAIKEGLSPERAKERALTEFELSVGRTQQAGNVQDLGQIQRGGSFAKWMTMFITAQNAYFRQEYSAARNIVKGRAGITDNLRRIAVAHFLLPMIFQFVASGFRWEPDKQRRARWLGSLNGILVIGDLLESLAEALFEGSKYIDNTGQIPALSPFTDIGNSLGAINKMITNDELNTEDWSETLKAIVTNYKFRKNFLSGTSKIVGIPYDIFRRYYEAYEDIANKETQYPVRRAFGYSRYMMGESHLSRKKLNKPIGEPVQSVKEQMIPRKLNKPRGR